MTTIENRLIRNSIRTPDGTILESTHRHDYRTHKDTITGETYMVDGGLDYQRYNVCKTPHEDLSLYDDQPHEVQREVLKWGTRGVNGDQPLKYLKIKDMDTDHIEACLSTQKHMGVVYRNCMEEELKWRN